MFFTPGVHTFFNQFVHRMKVTAPDFFLHKSFGFRVELHCHPFNLSLIRDPAQARASSLERCLDLSTRKRFIRATESSLSPLKTPHCRHRRIVSFPALLSAPPSPSDPIGSRSLQPWSR